MEATANTYYRVKENGTVWAFSKWRSSIFRWRQLVANPSRYGYLMVRIMKDGKRCNLYVHKAIAGRFLPARPSPRHQLRHLDGNKLNNRPENLAWGTAKDNADDRSRHGRTAMGERNGFSKLSDEARANIATRVIAGDSPTMLARQYKITVSNVYKIKARDLLAKVKEE